MQALVLALVASSAAAPPGVLYAKRSLYRNILVTDEGDRTCLSFRLRTASAEALQSCMYKAEHDKLVFHYAKAVMAGLLVQPAPERILILGLGGGSIPRVLRKVLPQAQIEIVEIDEAVVQVAHDWFDFTPEGNVQVRVRDGRQFVRQAGILRRSYDLVVLDAFNGDYIPEHMMTREFLEECKRILAPGGVLVANTFSSSKLYQSESATYAAAFGSFTNIKHGEGNRIVLARNGPAPTLAQLEVAVRALQPRLAPFGVDYAEILADVRAQPDWDPQARVLIDDWNPANVMKGW